MKKRITDDENAVSISVGTVLMLSITVITLVVVIGSFYTMMDRHEHAVTRDQFEIHGNDMALQISNIDTAVQITNNYGGKAENISYHFSLPPTIARHQYSIELSNSTREIIFRSQSGPGTEVKVTYVTSTTDVASNKIYSGQDYFELYYDANSNLIGIR
jgi:FlaG/FlaF family flagellin (archaellin)